MEYYLNISDTSVELQDHKVELSDAPFWGNPIRISRKLFGEIELYKSIMIDRDDEELKGEIENFERLFKKSTHLNYRETIVDKVSSTIHCNLSAYFEIDYKALTPF